MTKPPPRYLSKKPLTRYGSVKNPTKRELVSVVKKALKKLREKRNAGGVPFQ